MQYSDTPIEGLKVIFPKVFKDERGFFCEAFNKVTYKDIIPNVDFIQQNHSKSSYGVLRGLHFQKRNSQAKLVRVIAGEVLDVAVDLRKGSPTLGKHFSILLSSKNMTQFYIPRGFAHGFQVISPEAEFEYLCDNIYDKSSEMSLSYNDTDLGISWFDTGESHTLSHKDSHATSWRDLIQMEGVLYE